MNILLSFQKLPLKRIAILALPLLIQLLYFPLNRYQSGGIPPSIYLDQLMPLFPIWAIPYLLAVPYWVLMYLWAGFKMENGLFSPFVFSSIIIFLVGQLTFLVYPTYVIRPQVNQLGWDYDLLRWIYTNDQAYNALPSGHAYISTIIFLFWIRWKPRGWWLWGLIWITILLSTIFTGQHYLLDLVAGCLLSFLVFLGYIKLTKRQTLKNIGLNPR